MNKRRSVIPYFSAVSTPSDADWHRDLAPMHNLMASVTTRCPVERPSCINLLPLARTTVHRRRPYAQRLAGTGSKHHGGGLPSRSPVNGRTEREQPVAGPRLEDAPA